MTISYFNQLKPYQNFNDVTELKTAFNLYRRKYRFKLTKADNEILFIMVGYAVKFTGVCKMKLETIVEVTGFSISTVKRTIKKAIELGIIKRIHTRKENGRRQGSNVYQFQHFDDEPLSEPLNEPQETDNRQNDEIPCESKIEEPKNDNESPYSLKPFNSFKDTNITENPNEHHSVDKELIKKNALLDKLPNALRGLSVFFDKSQEIYDIAGVIFDAKNKVSKEIRIEQHEGLFRKTVASVYEYWKRKVKSGIEDYNVFGLMNKAIKELVEKIVNGTAYQVNKPQPKKAQGRTEYIPNWFHKRHENVVEVNTQETDFEAERLKFLAKLENITQT